MEDPILWEACVPDSLQSGATFTKWDEVSLHSDHLQHHNTILSRYNPTGELGIQSFGARLS